ncbi:MAG: ATP-binding cassette domain-containing protein [Candidatus Eisenbacteria bacterium]|nr:ATP-binding cassette domain-containing protein [Candidatus Latescibacterota bacterium]MBD3301694.1 ATP-binding cassette domain-containing protein [Candidatus Eisenbacteria bacterium]
MPPSPEEEPLYRKQIDRRLLARLLQFVRPHRSRLILAVVLLVLLSVAELAFPLLMKTGIDRYIKTGDTAGLLRISGLYLGLLVVVFVLRYTQTTTTQGLGQRVMYDLRMRLFRHVQRLSLPYFERNPVGRVMTRLTNDVEVLNELFTSGLVSIFGDILILVGIISIMLYLDVKLALACFLVLPPLVLATLFFRARVREAYTVIRIKVAGMNSFLQEMLSGISLVQLFRREKASAERFDRLNGEHRDAFLRSVRAYAVYFPVVELLETIAVALILAYGGSRVLDGTLTLGLLVAFIQYSERFFRPIRDLSQRYNILQGAMASSERVFELLDSQPRITTPRDGRTPDRVEGEIVFDGVRFGYKPDEPILPGLSFRIAPGESVALVGHTGAGKTTIASLLVRFYDVWDGSIRIDGVDIRKWDLHALRRRIAVVPQDVYLFSGSARRNIGLLDPSVSEERVLEASRAVGAAPFLEQLPAGLDTELRERGSLLSVGQRQLLSFARALAHDPSVLVLDEATSSVDTQTELAIRRALRVLIRGRTSLVIAHRLSTIRHVDRILVLHRGKLVEQGTHEELLGAGGIYAKLYQLEFKIQEGLGLDEVSAG